MWVATRCVCVSVDAHNACVWVHMHAVMRLYVFLPLVNRSNMAVGENRQISLENLCRSLRNDVKNLLIFDTFDIIYRQHIVGKNLTLNRDTI